MARFRFPLTLALLVICLATLAAPLAAQEGTLQSSSQIKPYHLPPGKYERAVAYCRWQYAMHFLGVLWTVGTLAAILSRRVAPRLRSLAEGATAGSFLQAAIFVPGLMLALCLPRLPLDVFGQWLERHYDQSVQGWFSWLWDWTKGELLGIILATLLAWILYGVIRRSPRRWWFRFWLASLPILVFLFFIQPLLIEPMFFEFKPLGETQPALMDAIMRVAGRGGLSIPADRMYEMNASEKLNSLNAYVSGIGASKRVVVWDTIIAKMTPSQIQFVFGHEMGHYVLNHIPKGIALLAILLLLAMLVSYHGLNWALERWGSQWEIRGVEDWASLPLLILICTAVAFVAEPVANTVSRYFEHEADIYGIEVTFGLIPPASKTGTETFQILGEIGLAEPDPNPLIEFWLYDHPSISSRVMFAQQYDPWLKNETKYVR